MPKCIPRVYEESTMEQIRNLSLSELRSKIIKEETGLKLNEVNIGSIRMNLENSAFKLFSSTKKGTIV